MLLTPGPTPVPEFVRKAMADITIHHRTPEFEAIFKETRELLLELFAVAIYVFDSWFGSKLLDLSLINDFIYFIDLFEIILFSSAELLGWYKLLYAWSSISFIMFILLYNPLLIITENRFIASIKLKL